MFTVKYENLTCAMHFIWLKNNARAITDTSMLETTSKTLMRALFSDKFKAFNVGDDPNIDFFISMRQ